MAILDQFGHPIKPQPQRTERRQQRLQRVLRASYDAAQTTDENRKHWQYADSYSANAANDKETRQTLRDRARYECANNSYAHGLVNEIAEAVVGTGPRLQLQIPQAGRKAAREIERLFGYWCSQVNFAEKLRVAEITKVRDGEVFALEITNPELDPFLPQIDLKLYEAEQIATPFLFTSLDPRKIDGIEFDDYGNPKIYHLLKVHPGSEYAFSTLEKDDMPASRMRHYFRPDRPGQSRGIPEIMAALPLFAQMRRMTLAVITAAEFAACISGVMESDLPPEYQGSDTESGDDPAFDRIELERGALLTTPRGWKARGFETNQPFASYGEFKGEILNEAGRAVSTPGIAVSGDYSKLNYSSGRLANLPYHRSIRSRRNECRARVLDATFRTWLRMAFLMGLLPAEMPPIAMWTWRWDWDGFQSVDPQKEAAAREIMLRIGLTNEALEYAEQGIDWEEALEQKAIILRRKKELEAEYGIRFDASPTSSSSSPPVDDEEIAVE